MTERRDNSMEKKQLLRTRSFKFVPVFDQKIEIRRISQLRESSRKFTTELGESNNFSNIQSFTPLTKIGVEKGTKYAAYSQQICSKQLKDEKENTERKNYKVKISSKRNLKDGGNQQDGEQKNIHNTLRVLTDDVRDKKRDMHQSNSQTLTNIFSKFNELGQDVNQKMNMESVKSIFVQTLINHDKNRSKKTIKEMSDISHLYIKPNLNKQKLEAMKKKKKNVHLETKDPLVFLEMLNQPRFCSKESRIHDLRSLESIEKMHNLEEKMKNQYLFPRISEKRFEGLSSKVEEFLFNFFPNENSPERTSEFFLTNNVSENQILHRIKNFGNQAIASFHSLDKFRKISVQNIHFVEQKIECLWKKLIEEPRALTSSSLYFRGQIEAIKLFHQFSAFTMKKVHDELAPVDLGYSNLIINSAFLNYFVTEFSLELFEELLRRFEDIKLSKIITSNKSVIKQRDELLTKEKTKDEYLAIVKEKYKKQKNELKNAKTQSSFFENLYQEGKVELLKLKGEVALMNHRHTLFTSLIKETIKGYGEDPNSFTSDPDCLVVKKLQQVVMMSDVYNNICTKYDEGLIDFDQAMSRLEDVVSQSKYHDLTTMEGNQKCKSFLGEAKQYEEESKLDIKKAHELSQEKRKSEYLNKKIRTKSFMKGDKISDILNKNPLFNGRSTVVESGPSLDNKRYTTGSRKSHRLTFISGLKNGSNEEFAEDLTRNSRGEFKTNHPTLKADFSDSEGSKINNILNMIEVGVQTNFDISSKKDFEKSNSVIEEKSNESCEENKFTIKLNDFSETTPKNDIMSLILNFEHLDSIEYLDENRCFSVLDQIDEVVDKLMKTDTTFLFQKKEEWINKLIFFYQKQKEFSLKKNGKFGYLFIFALYKLKKIKEKLKCENSNEDLKMQRFQEKENDCESNSDKEETDNIEDELKYISSENINRQQQNSKVQFREKKGKKSELKIDIFNGENEANIRTSSRFKTNYFDEEKSEKRFSMNPGMLKKNETPEKRHKTKFASEINKRETPNSKSSKNLQKTNFFRMESLVESRETKQPISQEKRRSSLVSRNNAEVVKSNSESRRFSCLPDDALLIKLREEENLKPICLKFQKKTEIRRAKFEKEATKIYRLLTGAKTEERTKTVSETPLLQNKAMVKLIHSIYESGLGLKGIKEYNIAYMTMEVLSRVYTLESQLFKKYTQFLINILRFYPENSSIKIFAMFLGLFKYLDENSFRLYLDVLAILKERKIDYNQLNFKIDLKTFLEITNEMIPEKFNISSKFGAEVEKNATRENGRLLVDFNQMMIQFLQHVSKIVQNMNDLFFRIGDFSRNGQIGFNELRRLILAFESTVKTEQLPQIQSEFDKLAGEKEYLSNEDFMQLISTFNILNENTKIRFSEASKSTGIVSEIGDLVREWPMIKKFFLSVANSLDSPMLIPEIFRYDKYISNFDVSFQEIIWFGYKMVENEIDCLLIDEMIRFSMLDDFSVLILSSPIYK